MTLFGGQLTTPTQRNEAAMRKALELRRQFWSRKPGQFYDGAGDLLLRHGRFMPGRELPTEYAHHLGNMGRCFENALLAAEADPSLRYCEGVYTFGSGLFSTHAWCLDPKGQVLEVTAPTTPEAIANGIEPNGFGVLPLDHWGYWGVTFDAAYVRAVFDLQDGSGLLDRPSGEAGERAKSLVAYSAEDIDSVEEWREDWHVYHYPYDPTRTTP